MILQVLQETLIVVAMPFSPFYPMRTQGDVSLWTAAPELFMPMPSLIVKTNQ
ncbi:hypothetical protein DPMN_108688 [Dreissena polymorpha]|uniref:Uncharacterized protein n=1 Tax=Dreissena polymorpha TaxID=45954 RepID=A0A9D4QMA3_DREPO|nr:hypothetical protein DPMN_108688 [Dreissena polymorpha]